MTAEARVSSRVPALALTFAELIPMASPSARTEKRAVLGVVLASSESKESVRRLPLTVALERLADCGVVEVSRIVSDFCVSSVLRLASENSCSLSDSVPSVVLSAARAWVRENSPVLSMADEPLRVPEEKSLELMPDPQKAQ